MHKVLTLYTHSTNKCDSYGIIACELARHLTRQGYYVNVLTTSGTRVHNSQDEEVKAIMRQPVFPTCGGIVLAYPTAYTAFGPLIWEGPRVGVVTFESDRLPDDWIANLNRLDAISTPSTWSADIFRRSGVTVPIVVNHEGIEGYSYSLRTDDKPFTFLTFMDFIGFGRKGWDLALWAFNHAFGNDPDYRMIVKARVAGLEQITAIDNPNIDLLKAEMSEAELNDLYAQCDVMVASSRGEGFGRLPREFALTGGLALATNWSGLTDHIEQWGDPLNEFTMIPAWRTHERFKHVGSWAECDHRALAEEMKRVAAMPASERNALGLVRSQAVQRLYKWEHYAAEVAKLWRMANMKVWSHA